MGYIAHKDIYYNKHVFTSKGSHAMYRQEIENVTTEYEQGSIYRHSHLHSFYLWTRRHSSHTKQKEDPLIGKGVDRVRRPLWPWALADRMGPRDRAGYLPPLGGRRVVTSRSHDS